MQVLRTQSYMERLVIGVHLLPPGMRALDEPDSVSFVDAHAYFDLAFYRSAANMGYLVEALDGIAQIACPMLLLTDRPMLPDTTTELGGAVFEQHWRTGQHLHFEESGHFVMFDQFDRFIEVLPRFLGAHGGAA